MGRLKQLLPVGDKTVIGRCLESILAAGIEDIIVVVGRNGEEIANHLAGCRITITHNDNPESEMADSVRTGLSKVSPLSSGILICLSDHPLVSADTIKAVTEFHLREPQKIIIPSYKARRGHPSLFPIQVINEIYEGLNLRDIINCDPERIEYLDVIDEGVLFDMDTMEDYKKIS